MRHSTSRANSALQPSLIDLGSVEWGTKHSFAALEYPILTPEDLVRTYGHRVALDTESTGLKWWVDTPLELGVWCPDGGVKGIITLTGPEENLVRCSNLLQLAPAGTTLRFHNAKYDCHVLQINPCERDWVLEDSIVMTHLMDSRNRKKLELVEKQWLGTETKHEHRGKKLPQSWPFEIRANYCVNDARVTYELCERLLPEIKSWDLYPLFTEQMDYLGVIWEMEETGFLVDQERIARSIKEVTEELDRAEEILIIRTGQKFNWRSPAQLSRALYEGMDWPRPVNPFLSEDGLDHTRFAKRGRYNETLTDSMILIEKAHHPLGSLILHMREMDKFRETLEGYKSNSEWDGVVRCSLNLTGTRTGRLSCSEPNMQNVTNKVKAHEMEAMEGLLLLGAGAERGEAQNLRMNFLARPGYTFLSIDYKQMEMRKFGILANEPIMISALRSGKDIHAEVSNMVWHVVDDVHRKWSKTIGFGLIYAMSTGALQLQLNMTEKEAREICDQYLATFPRIRPWLKETMAQCMRMGYLRYASGRIWKEEVEMDSYKGANAVIQGDCADLLSYAGLRCHAFLASRDWGHMLLPVHDEFVFEIKDEHLSEAILCLGKLMEVPDFISMVFNDDVKVGKVWGQLEKWKGEEK